MESNLIGGLSGLICPLTKKVPAKKKKVAKKPCNFAYITMSPKSKSTAIPRLSWLLFLTLVLPFLSFRPNLFVGDSVKKVIIDAGHGGKDPGNMGTRRYKITEKDVALSVALQVAEKIKKLYPDVEVVLTRNSDRFLELYERTAIANRENADLFISIHCDAAENRSAYGASTYVMGKNHDDENQVALRENSVILLEDDYEQKYEGFDPRKPESIIALTLYQYAFQNQSIEFAQIVQNAFKSDLGRKDRGVRQQPLYVTSRCSMPSVLIELGFTTNSVEEDYLHSVKGQDEMSTAIARSFGAYKARREKTVAEGQVLVETKKEPVIEFAIQLAVSSLKKDVKEAPFKSLENVWILADGRLYKYLQGHYSSIEEAQKALENIKSSFTDAFILAFEDNRRISVEDAIERIKNKQANQL